MYTKIDFSICSDSLLTQSRSNAEALQFQSIRSRVSKTELLREAAKAHNLRRAESKRHQKMLDQKPKESFENRPSPDRQAAFELARLADPRHELSLGRDQVENLIKTLLVSFE